MSAFTSFLKSFYRIIFHGSKKVSLHLLSLLVPSGFVLHCKIGDW